MKIDSHHHFWRYSSNEYPWIGDDMKTLRRDFLPPDLKATIDEAGIEGVVSVQARQSLEETRALLGFARDNPWILGVVGWVPLASADIENVLDEVTSQDKLKAVRHVVQGEADGFLEGAAFNAGIRALEQTGLLYDLLVVERQLPEAIAFVDRHPNQRFALDHIAKPLIKDETFEPWQTHIRELARRPNVTCKVSGMVTEADFHSWTPGALRPYFDVVLEVFGPGRLMFGSDWPVCLAACSYARWIETVEAWTNELSADERVQVWGETARAVYGLD